MEVTIYSTLIWITAVIIGSLGVVIYIGSKRLSSRAFAYSTFWVTIWIVFVGFFVASRDHDSALFYCRFTFYLGSVIASSFLYFFLTYPEDRKPSFFIPIGLTSLQIVLGYLFLFTDKLIKDVEYIGLSSNPWAWYRNPLAVIIFDFFFFSFFTIGITILYQKYSRCVDPQIKANLKFMFWAFVAGTTPPSLLTIIFPAFGYFGLSWLGPVTEIIWIPIIAYSIFKYQQMSVRAVIAEVLVIAMTILFFINIFITTTPNIWARIATFIAFIALAYYLAHGALREAKQKEQLAELNQKLEQKVAEQTKEIRTAYDAEKKARRELEKLNETKDQFIMITQHHLRLPVSTIDTELQAMQDGSYGRPTPGYARAIASMRSAASRLLRIVDDFLSITTIKVGTPILTPSSTDLLPLVKDALADLKDEIERMHISVKLKETADSWPELMIDREKMREVVLTVIENAVRYNHENGSIWIETARTKIHSDDKEGSGNKNMFKLTVVNTGFGLTAEERQRISTGLFYRGDKARAAHPTGMGIGLKLCRAVVKAHGGTFEIESEGENKGAKVTIVLPLDTN